MSVQKYFIWDCRNISVLESTGYYFKDRSACLCHSAETKGVCHHTQLELASLQMLEGLSLSMQKYYHEVMHFKQSF